MPSASQDPDGTVAVSLGAKGVIEVELVASGEKWGRGPSKDVHSANRARLDSPAFHLVQALATLVTKDGDPAIEGFATAAKGSTPAQSAMLDEAARRMDEATAKKVLGATRWAHDASWRESLERALLPPDGEHRGARRRLHGPRREDGPSAPRGRQARPAARPRHDVRRRPRRPEGAPGQARLRRPRGERDRRLQPDASRAPTPP